MGFLHIFKDIPIDIVLFTFVFSISYTCYHYLQVGKELVLLNTFLKQFSKTDLNYRFKELDEWLSTNPYTTVIWNEFKTTLVFSERVALKRGNQNVEFKDVSSNVQNILTTVDPLFYFNEDTLINSRFNYKMVQAFPTLLTGFGPLFTFLNISIAFGKIDFSTQEKTISSVSNFMGTMQVAALVSVVAVGSSLIFILVEKLLANRILKIPLGETKKIIGELFECISSEKFLHELLKETKIQNDSTSNMIGQMPENLKYSLNTSIMENLVPYLENVIFGLNQLSKQLKEIAKNSQSKSDVDDLF